jgi:hypothetical protein
LIGTMSERTEGHEQQHEGEAEHEREDVRQPRFHDLQEVLGGGGHARHRHFGAGQPPDRGRDDLAAQDVERVVGGRIGAAAAQRERVLGDGVVRADVQALQRGAYVGRGHVARLDGDHGGQGAAGERALEAVVGLDDRQAA